ncbi:GNS1/SUR4 family protein [Thecamonas trahens ATCC 50062]|uniref:Elongation of fatty acids protein n=1 Tax=Thecamonas trahens ATCC 50062 TaxID=461836 RepID=A0A0L0DQ99_THETB|nr:GNS1/SUR4 family protein [Thecamonas trahens ATCC 50062]KNC54450.1 GNS1/SUR4 family protein [Thecamonas trahens ATCC 50062]|eukprot:XP_013753606.1 GNS1/SUR4 family protein [Thecamonas trahens ATCC 50062]
MEMLNAAMSYPSTFEWIPGTTLLSTRPVMFGTLIVYLLVIFGLQEVMATKTTPSWVKPAIVVHNLILFLYSATSVITVLYLAISYSLEDEYGFVSVFCDQYRKYTSGPMYFLIYTFYLSKYYELLDTVFLALKKRPIIFLHVFHHVLTLYTSFSGMDSETTYQWTAVLTNTTIHSFMYYYYLRAAMGAKIWWKKYLTVAQMIQFGINVLILFGWAAIDLNLPEGQDCAGNYFCWWLMFGGMIAFFTLFKAFFNKSYKKPAAKSE